LVKGSGERFQRGGSNKLEAGGELGKGGGEVRGEDESEV